MDIVSSVVDKSIMCKLLNIKAADVCQANGDRAQIIFPLLATIKKKDNGQLKFADGKLRSEEEFRTKMANKLARIEARLMEAIYPKYLDILPQPIAEAISPFLLRNAVVDDEILTPIFEKFANLNNLGLVSGTNYGYDLFDLSIVGEQHRFGNIHIYEKETDITPMIRNWLLEKFSFAAVLESRLGQLYKNGLL